MKSVGIYYIFFNIQGVSEFHRQTSRTDSMIKNKYKTTKKNVKTIRYIKGKRTIIHKT
jgi:hypothetical protein